MPAFVANTEAPTHLGRFRSGPAALSPGVGVPFRPDLFGAAARIVVEAAFGADVKGDASVWTWFDISTDVRYAGGGRVAISPMGRSDEASQAQPAGCAFQLDNASGDYTAYRAASRWYPYVRRNTPIRVRVNLTGLPSDWVVRFQGYATGWTPTWDITGKLPVVSVQAQGATRRLAQGKTPLYSPIRRATAFAAPVSYWPLEDAAQSTQAGAGTVGGAVLTERTVVPAWADDTSLAGSMPLPKLINGVKSWTDTILSGPVAVTSAAAWSISVWVKATSAELVTSHAVTLLSWPAPAGAAAPWVLQIAANEPTYAVLAAFSNSVRAHSTTNVFDGGWHHIAITAEQTAASQITTKVYVDGSVGSIDSLAAYTLTPVTAVDVLRAQDVVLGPVTIWGGHVAFFDSVLSAATIAAISGAGGGYAGESPTARVQRLCAEQSMPVSITGSSTSTMGPQGTDTFLALLRECETVDQGVLYDGLGPGLGYVSRAERYNRPASLTVDAVAGQLGHPFEPVDDDQRNRNYAKVDRKNGSSAVFEQVTGPLGDATIGLYDTSLTVNAQADADLPQYASWLTHLGTVNGFRYPRLNLNLVASPAIASAWINSRPSHRIDVAGVSAVAPEHPTDSVRLLLEGWSEQLSPFDWDVQANTSQYDPWRVAVLDTSGYLDCGACTLAAALDTTQTTVAVAIADVCTWTHADGDYNIVVDGEQMTVTAVSAPAGSGSAWTQTLTVVRSVNGVTRAHAVGAEVHVADPFIPAL